MAQLEFPILRTQEEFEQGPLLETLVEAQGAIVSAQHLVVIFTLWHETMPALLKAFLEQVMRPGVALEYRKRGFPRGLLAGRSARIVVTMGMPILIYRWYFRAHGVRGLERSVLRFAGMKPRPRDPYGDGRCGERCQAAGVARSDEGLRQSARLRDSNPAHHHYQFPAAQILKADVNMASPKRLRWSGACSKVVEASTSAVGTPRADLGAMAAGSDDPWRFI